MIEQNLIWVLEQYEADRESIDYGLEPNRQGKSKIVAKMRLKRTKLLLTRVGGLSILVGLLVIITSLQSENTVPMSFFAGWFQIFLG